MTTIRRTIANLLIPASIIRESAEPTLVPGDVVRDADGSLCCIERIGWVNGEVSPFVGHDALQAYVWGFYEDGDVWVEWADLHTLSAEAVSSADIDRFCEFVKRDLESLKRSFTAVALACEC